MTNWEKYFGSPDKASLMRISLPANPFSQGFFVAMEPDREDEVHEYIGHFENNHAFLEWLKEESE